MIVNVAAFDKIIRALWEWPIIPSFGSSDGVCLIFAETLYKSLKRQ